MHFCPHPQCDYRGWLGLNNLRAHGHPSSGPWRQLHCLGCDGYFLATHGTLLHGQHAAVELIVRVLACLAEGLGSRATARGFEIDANTVRQWLVEAAEQLRAFSRYFLCEVHVQQEQLDALYAVSRDLKAGELRADDAIKRLASTRSWVWTAMEPGSQWLLALAGGPRPLERAQGAGHQVVGVLAPGGRPARLSDGCTGYLPAILGPCGGWGPPERRQDKGPGPTPRWLLLPGLLDAQVIKQYRRKRLVGDTPRGCLAHGRRASTSWQRVAGRSIRLLWNGSTSTSVSASRRWGVG